MNHSNRESEYLLVEESLNNWDKVYNCTESLNESIISVLGEHYSDLKDFYYNIMINHDNYDYIAFVVRRSLLLAELFFNIFWEEGNENLRYNLIEARKKFRTDSSILMFCREDVMPTVLLVDELMLQGDSINKLLHEMGSIFKESHGVSEIKSDFLSRINISVFCRDVNTLIVTDCLFENFHVARWMENKEWHDFSNRVGILIQDFPLINAAFTLGISVPRSEESVLSHDMKGFRKVETESKELKETVYFFEKQDFATVRSIYHKATKSYTLIPFLFLPDIPDDVFLQLSEKIVKYLLPDGMHGKVLIESRYSHELTSLFLSTTLLEIFCKGSIQSNLNQLNPNIFGILANFGLTYDEKIGKEFLDKVQTPLSFWSESEFLVALDDLTIASEKIISTKSGKSSAEIGQFCEDYIYARKIEELENIDKKSKGLYYGDPTRSETLMNCLENLSETSEELFAWLLQLMDRGIISLKTETSDSHVKQILRAGEASLFIRPKRYEQFLPLFSMYSTRMHRVKMEDVISGLIAQLTERGRLTSEQLEGELNEFLSQIKRSDQEFSSWNIPLFSEGFYYKN